MGLIKGATANIINMQINPIPQNDHSLDHFSPIYIRYAQDKKEMHQNKFIIRVMLPHCEAIV
jgi:hypothetical protein